MELLTSELRETLLRNGRLTRQCQIAGEDEPDFAPVVKIFTPDANCTWLLTELDPDEPDIAFGLCDLGMGCPELGSVSISELKSVRGCLGLPAERDLYFEARFPLSVFASAARQAQCITEDVKALERAGGQS